MTYFSKFLGLGLGVLLAGGCDGSRQTGPISLTPGSAEYQQRQDQLRSATGDPGRASQNPVAVGRANPGSDSATSIGVGDVQRTYGTGGTAGASAGTPTAVNPSTTGIERGRGVGAPQ
jgi:hypothetical protein